MNRLKKIFAAIRELGSDPSPAQAIADAWKCVETELIAADGEPEMEVKRNLNLISKVIAAVCSIADDQDKPKAQKADA